MAKTIRELEQEIGAKRAQLSEFFEAHTVAEGLKMSRDDVAEVKRRNSELHDLGEELDLVRSAEDMRRSLVAAGDPDERKSGDGARRGEPIAAKGERVRSLSEILDGSQGFKQFRVNRTGTAVMELSDEEYKTLITLTDMSPQADRRPVVNSAQAYEPVSDLFAQGTTERSSLEFYAETTFTNNAAERAEGDAFGESALSWTLTTSAIRSVGAWVPLTEETLMDNGEMESLVRNRLAFMVPKRRDLQLLVGDGIAPNLKGVTAYGSIQTQAKGADPTFDAVMKAMTKIRVTGDAEPTAAVFHPNDWQDIILTRTTEGIYIMGNPGDPQANKRLWALAVRAVPAMTENTGLIGAFNPYGEFVRRKGITLTVSTEHSDYFIKNKIAIKADERVGLRMLREAAFCTVTGI